jgi:Protein of unknown function (DUF1566)
VAPVRLLCAAVLVASLPACERQPVEQPIVDKARQIMWSPNVSPNLITWQEALAFCRQYKFAGYSDWRLPTKPEVESMINPDLVDENPDSAVVPLYGPFSEPAEGFLFSGTVVPGYKDAPYVMNIRNGHIFNGQGRTAFARCARDLRFEPSK